MSNERTWIIDCFFFIQFQMFLLLAIPISKWADEIYSRKSSIWKTKYMQTTPAACINIHFSVTNQLNTILKTDFLSLARSLTHFFARNDGTCYACTRRIYKIKCMQSNFYEYHFQINFISLIHTCMRARCGGVEVKTDIFISVWFTSIGTHLSKHSEWKSLKLIKYHYVVFFWVLVLVVFHCLILRFNDCHYHPSAIHRQCISSTNNQN